MFADTTQSTIEQDESGQGLTKDNRHDIQSNADGQHLPQAKREHILDCEDYFSIDDVSVQDYLAEFENKHNSLSHQHFTTSDQESGVLTEHSSVSTQHTIVSTQQQNTTELSTASATKNHSTPPPPNSSEPPSTNGGNHGNTSVSQEVCDTVRHLTPSHEDTADYENSDVIDNELSSNSRPCSRGNNSDFTREPVYGNVDSNVSIGGNSDTVLYLADYENDRDLDTMR